MPTRSRAVLSRPASFVEARRFVRDTAAASASRQVLDDAMLLTSELVTNAVRHTGHSSEDPIELTVSVDERILRVTVRDRGPGFDPDELPLDPRTAAGDSNSSGSSRPDGVSIAAELGNDVWFEIDLAPSTEDRPTFRPRGRRSVLAGGRPAIYPDRLRGAAPSPRPPLPRVPRNPRSRPSRTPSCSAIRRGPRAPGPGRATADSRRARAATGSPSCRCTTEPTGRARAHARCWARPRRSAARERPRWRGRPRPRGRRRRCHPLESPRTTRVRSSRSATDRPVVASEPRCRAPPFVTVKESMHASMNDSPRPRSPFRAALHVPVSRTTIVISPARTSASMSTDPCAGPYACSIEFAHASELARMMSSASAFGTAWPDSHRPRFRRTEPSLAGSAGTVRESLILDRFEVGGQDRHVVGGVGRHEPLDEDPADVVEIPVPRVRCNLTEPLETIARRRRHGGRRGRPCRARASLPVAGVRSIPRRGGSS